MSTRQPPDSRAAPRHADKRPRLARKLEEQDRPPPGEAAPSWLHGMVAGILLLVGVLAVVAAVFGSLYILSYAFVMVWVIGAFRGVGVAAAWLLGSLAAAAALGGIGFFAGRRALRAFRARPLGASNWIGFASGILVTLVIALTLTPYEVKDEVVKLATGRSLTERTGRPAADADVEHMRTVIRPRAEAGDPRAQFALGLALRYGIDGEPIDRQAEGRWIGASAAHPDGHEARIMLATEQVASPVGDLGRVVNREDVARQVAALEALQESREGPWRPIVWGTAALVQQATYGASTDADAPMRAALDTAGRAGSRAFMMFAGASEESTARHAGRSSGDDTAGRHQARAIAAYARAGNHYEAERARIESGWKGPSPVEVLKPQPVDPDFSARLHEFSELLDGERVPDGHAPPGNRILAQAAALIAMEVAPDPASIAGTRPATRLSWQSSGAPLRRWLLALRHARDDCMAALELSSSIEFELGTGESPSAPFNAAWALAWAERAVACAESDADQAKAAERARYLSRLAAMDPDVAAEREAARDGAAAMVAALR